MVLIPPSQPTLTLEKEALSGERPQRTPRPPRKKQKQLEELELPDSDEYADFTGNGVEYTTTIVGDETSSAVQSIQQVGVPHWTCVSLIINVRSYMRLEILLITIGSTCL